MRSVLGIDAAWTSRNPSGVALVVEKVAGWELVAAAASYADFCSPHRQIASKPSELDQVADVENLLEVSRSTCGCSVDLVAIDIPLSLDPINGRRMADNAVSIAYGSRNCGTHTPSSIRPGLVSTDLTLGFERNGYDLRTTSPVIPGLIEVYPHPALVELARASDRLKYKYGNRSKYWKHLEPDARLRELRHVWSNLASLLEEQISGVLERLPELNANPTGAEYKAYEDTLDAVVCAWVGICALNGVAKPYGNDRASIWIPSPLEALSIR